MIHSTAIIGAEPFNYPRLPDGTRPYVKGVHTPHSVSLTQDVDIYPHAIIVRGTTRSTRLHRWSRIGPRAQIGHDSIIGEHACIGVGAIVGGFAEIGEKTTLGMGAIVLNRVRIGRNCLVGAGAVVTKDVPDNTVVAGVPATFQRMNDPLED